MVLSCVSELFEVRRISLGLDQFMDVCGTSSGQCTLPALLGDEYFVLIDLVLLFSTSFSVSTKCKYCSYLSGTLKVCYTFEWSCYQPGYLAKQSSFLNNFILHADTLNWQSGFSGCPRQKLFNTEF